MADYRRDEVASVSKALRMLKLFSDSQPELTLSDFCKILGIPKSTAHRLLATMESEGFVERVEATNRYKLGSVLFRLGSVIHNRLDIRVIAMPVMRSLSAETGESVVLVIPTETERLCIEKVDSPNTIRPFVKVGVPLPLHAGASGLVLFAHMSPGDVDRVISEKGLYPLTPRTLTDRDALDSRLQQIRQDGFAVTRGDRVSDGSAVSAPIRNAEGRVVAALTVSLPLSRLTDERLPHLISAVTTGAATVSSGLGYVGGRDSE